jgi:sigma-B regulation protein RsbU (phosphoserine phosphatase)
LDSLSFVIGLAALIGGIVLGVVIAQRRRPEPTSTWQPTMQSAEGTALANLMLFLGDPVDLRSLLERAAEWLRLETAAKAVVIYPYDSASQEFRNPVHAGATLLDPTYQFRSGSGIFGEVGAARQPRVIEDVSREPRFRAAAHGVASAYIVPLVADNTMLGVAVLQSGTVDGFSIERQRAIDQYAALVAIQGMVARRFTDSRQAIARFEHFQALSQVLVSHLELQELLQPIVNAAREMLDTQMSILLEVRPPDDRLHPVAWAGISDETALMLESRLKEDLKGLVAWAQLPARTHNVKTDQRTARATQAVVAGMISELAAPVKYADRLYGVLAVETNVYRNFTDEETVLLQSLAAQAGIALRNAQLYSRVKQTNGQLERSLNDLKNAQEELERAHAAEIRAYETELQTARDIQTSLLPQELPPIPRIQVAARNIPAQHVSGDFYQYMVLPGGKLGVVIGDVSGKGISAALLMAVTTTALREEASQFPNAATILTELNQRLLDRMQSTNMNSALCIAIFDPETGLTEIANAGMVTPYALSTAMTVPERQQWQAVEVGGYPLGASKRARYESRNLILTPNSMLLMVSDGVVECQNPAGEFFGFERLEKLLPRLNSALEPEQVIDLILAEVSAFAEGEDYQDDVTVVLMKAI